MGDIEARGSNAAGPVGSRFVRALLERHGIPSSRHTTLVAELLGFRYTLVHRRMKGDVAWEIEEIETVAAHFGETLATVFGAVRSDEYVSAVLVADGARVPCKLLLGGAIRDSDPNLLAAVRIGSQWVVCAAPQAGPGPAYAVRELIVAAPEGRPRRIAILDDDADEVASISEHFAERGCESEAFTRTEALLSHMKLRPFDAYVIDWVLDEGNAAELVAMIRADDPLCPIAVLTGKMESDLALENAVAEALSTHRLMFFQKPTRLPLVSSQLLRALDAQ
ncbi:MAG: response regulator [Burkholderiales bacterium]|nr:response regulator [Burkholderiales bacterium]